MRKVALVVMILAAGVLAGWCSSQALHHSVSRPRAVTPRGPLPAGEQAVIDRFREAKPSVVYITTIAYQRDWFSFDVQAVPTGTGSGFVWDEQGHIVTNFHVVEDAQELEVTLSDHSTHRAQVVGLAPERDLAVLRLANPPAHLRPIPIGTSSDLQVGQAVMAIGNPFGLDQTLTTGIVSALGREIQSSTRRRISGVIQTDAAINPGNSGGPLLDSAGRLIGVNTAIQSTSGSSAGIGFAVPVDTVNRIVPQLIAKGRLTRPDLGFETLDPSYASHFGNPKGLIVLQVRPGGPAHRAGLRGLSRSGRRFLLGDVITGLNGQPVRSVDDLLDQLEALAPDAPIQLDIQREGRAQRLALR
ncbi:MAG: trypsin-like peptidase domain-containing protein [Firmicutes bacterium]|nr:trypsin-like peptidase domain-containing protein [Bacillota bacterium]